MNDAQLTDMAVITAQPSRGAGTFDTTAEAGLVVHQQHCHEDPSPPSATQMICTNRYDRCNSEPLVDTDAFK